MGRQESLQDLRLKWLGDIWSAIREAARPRNPEPGGEVCPGVICWGGTVCHYCYIWVVQLREASVKRED